MKFAEDHPISQWERATKLDYELCTITAPDGNGRLALDGTRFVRGIFGVELQSARDPHEIMRNQLEFWKVQDELGTGVFGRIKSAVMGQGIAFSSSDVPRDLLGVALNPDPVQALEDVKKTVEFARRQIRFIEAAMSLTPEAIAKAEARILAEKDAEKAMAAHMEVVAKVRDINLEERR